MCGICGIFDLQDRGRADERVVHSMCDHLRHRGPDGDGFFTSTDNIAAIGMRRLSIIDVAGSDQPLFNENGQIALVFNGEIYNYRELRDRLVAQGHTLRTDGDGETLVHLYEQYGLGMFAHLRGMYAFALWDGERRQLLLAVDHIGMKPLYLWEAEGLLRLASEVKAFAADPAFATRLHLPALDAYLRFGYMIGAETLFEGVTRLPPGHALVLQAGKREIVPLEYWRFGHDFIAPAAIHELPTTRPHEMSSETAIIEHTRALLAEAVKLHLRSDVPLGLFLSGGIDSAATLALMTAEVGTVQTYTIGYAAETRDNELTRAARTATYFGAQHHERVITAEDWWAGYQRYVYHHDEPNANSSAVSLLLLAETTAEDVRVVLTGLGGDELFGGYTNHRLLAALARSRAASLPGAGVLAGAIGGVERWYPTLKRYRGLGALPTYLPRLRQQLLPPNEAALRVQSFDGLVFSDPLRADLYDQRITDDYTHRAFADILARSRSDDADDFAQAVVINTWLTGNALLSSDKVTMAYSLEARIPFFDPALLAHAARIPGNLRMRGNKYILREAMRGLLPPFALEQPKQPFSTPILGWFRHDLADRIQSVLRDSGAFIRPYFQPASLDRLLDGHFSGRAPQVEIVFRLLTLELWARRFEVNQVTSSK